MKILVFVMVLSAVLGIRAASLAQSTSPDIKLGVYYFDGWTGKTGHITPRLKSTMKDRKPVWGWVTSTPSVMQKQIDLASQAGISFFSFCWYYKRGKDSVGVAASPLNNALNLYLKAPNRKKLKFSLLIANHKEFSPKPADWPEVCEYWCKLFANPSYQKIDGKPLITFLNISGLAASFGGSENLRDALEKLRNCAQEKGLAGVSVAACVDPTPSVIRLAEQCGVDVLTGYNYHENGFGSNKDEIVPIDSMTKREPMVWNWLAQIGTKPVMPVITLNWDRRGWDNASTTYSQRFRGYSPNSVKNAVVTCKNWINAHNSDVVDERVAMIYAWNEYGEGAWLTPSTTFKNSLLKSLKDGLEN
jgi:hypothetical protein